MAELAKIQDKNATPKAHTCASGSQRVQDPAYIAFVKFNGATLQHLELPRHLWPALFKVRLPHMVQTCSGLASRSSAGTQPVAEASPALLLLSDRHTVIDAALD